MLQFSTLRIQNQNEFQEHSKNKLPKSSFLILKSKFTLSFASNLLYKLNLTKMSSMKSFKSRISHKPVDSNSKVNISVSESAADYNIKNVFMNAFNQISFKLDKKNDRIIIAPAVLQVTNNTGTRIFLHIVSSRQEYFSISPKKYILQNGNTLQITIKLIEISYVKLEDYEAESFQVSWGKITEQEIANKIIPKLTQSKVFKCELTNKDVINQFIAKKAYQNVLDPKKLNILEVSNFNLSRREDFARSRLNASDLHLYAQKPSLLRTNIIVGVAVISFIVGFISA